MNGLVTYTVHYSIPGGSNANHFELDVYAGEGMSDEDILKQAYNMGLDQNAVVVGISPWQE